MKTALFFSCEPGGAEVLVPVIRCLQKHSWKTQILSFGLGQKRFESHGIPNETILPWKEPQAPHLKALHADVLITSATSHPHFEMTEKFLWKAAQEIGLPQVAFLDQWQNYSLRFSSPENLSDLRYLPDHINALNSIGVQEMKAEGFPPKILKEWGHPVLDELSRKPKIKWPKEKIEKIGFDSQRPLVTFVSEALFEYYGDSRGYHQHSAFLFFLEQVKKNNWDFQIAIKTHPKEDPEKFKELIRPFADLKISVLEPQWTSQNVLEFSDAVVGMSSILLMEAYVQGISIVSVQPHLKVADPFLLSRHDLCPLWNEKTLNFHSPLENLSASSLPRFDFLFHESLFLRDLEELTQRKTSW